MQPLFIESSAGKLFAIYWPPAGETPLDKAIIHIPAFAEEMNKSRRMVALQAQAFSDQGYAVLVLDLFGTGDSAGDFGVATWQIWLQNIDTAIDWLKQQGVQSVDLWGLRVGALLAMDFASNSKHRIERLIAWQPVLNGDAFITQFLRLRVAAAMMDNNAPREKTSDLKQQLLEGQAIEVAGYLLNPDLIKPVAALRADRLSWQSVNEVAIFELVSSEDSPVLASNMQLLATLQEKNINVSLTKVVGNAFWSSQEISDAPNLIKVNSEKVGQWL
ncbi:hydrolase 2, exosortase A system-associated [Methylobacter sp.]|uniref:hydrolase 2, exosortase A system-associated n=1 Tax=Methylobacter sp. TaxID=2051955 RepID=UPI0011FB7D95|nr:hydrolase 2, exosortase A system-associated [Methylobacter sp.]TAK65178.1 MAG: hydrolase 2, exosortase A system-associated [Methylobacter sp.]